MDTPALALPLPLPLPLPCYLGLFTILPCNVSGCQLVVCGICGVLGQCEKSGSGPTWGGGAPLPKRERAPNAALCLISSVVGAETFRFGGCCGPDWF